VSLAHLPGHSRKPDHDAAGRELVEYKDRGYPIFVAESDESALVGYLACRVDGDVVPAESLYVSPVYRRHGIGSALYAQAEGLAQEVGGDTVYNWVDPDNDGVIRFLKKRGYNVFNLIELRRQRPGEKPTGTMRVGEREFDR
jgi:ribosomal protein S18 acetylase RimI-like enzyme